MLSSSKTQKTEKWIQQNGIFDWLIQIYARTQPVCKNHSVFRDLKNSYFQSKTARSHTSSFYELVQSKKPLRWKMEGSKQKKVTKQNG